MRQIRSITTKKNVAATKEILNYVSDIFSFFSDSDKNTALRLELSRSINLHNVNIMESAANRVVPSSFISMCRIQLVLSLTVMCIHQVLLVYYLTHCS